eukprot:Opistho-1_new@62757
MHCHPSSRAAPTTTSPPSANGCPRCTRRAWSMRWTPSARTSASRPRRRAACSRPRGRWACRSSCTPNNSPTRAARRWPPRSARSRATTWNTWATTASAPCGRPAAWPCCCPVPTTSCARRSCPPSPRCARPACPWRYRPTTTPAPHPACRCCSWPAWPARCSGSRRWKPCRGSPCTRHARSACATAARSPPGSAPTSWPGISTTRTNSPTGSAATRCSAPCSKERNAHEQQHPHHRIGLRLDRPCGHRRNRAQPALAPARAAARPRRTRWRDADGLCGRRGRAPQRRTPRRGPGPAGLAHGAGQPAGARRARAVRRGRRGLRGRRTG